MPRCPEGMRWDKQRRQCVPKGSRGGGGGGYEAGGGAGDGGIYIGVPDDYKAVGLGRRRFRPTTQRRPQGDVRTLEPYRDVSPIYKQGGEYRQLAGYSPDAIFQLQVRLVGLGYLEEEGWAPGVNDPKTAAAFKKLLAASNTRGEEWQDTINFLEANVAATGDTNIGGAGGGGGEAELPLQVTLTNPSDLAATLRATGGGPDQDFGLIGREPSAAEQMQFAESFQNQERMVQTDAYNRGLEAGEFTATPDPSVAAEDWLRQHRPGEVIGTNAAKASQVFYDLLANSRWRLSSG